MIEPKERRHSDTRHQILKEAEKLYRTGGYEKISLQKIADSLQISKPAVFHHFKDKQLLFFEMLKMMLEHMNEMLTNAIEQSSTGSRSKLLALMQRMTLEPRFDIMRLLQVDFNELNNEQQQQLNLQWFTNVYNLVYNIFVEGIKRGDLKPHDATISTLTFVNLWELLPYPDNPMTPKLKVESYSQAEYIEKLLDMFLGGLLK
jgi:AcrR family transcriptional regulator